MQLKLVKPLAVAAVLFVSAGLHTNDCSAWSLWGSKDKDKSTVTRPVHATTAKKPSTWDKLAWSTKNFFWRIGDALSLKKSKPKQAAAPRYAYPSYPGLKQQPKESKSWFGSWTQPPEPKKPNSVTQWMEQNEQIKP